MSKRDRQFAGIVDCLEFLYVKTENIETRLDDMPQAVSFSEAVRQEMNVIRTRCGKDKKKLKIYLKTYPPVTKPQGVAQSNMKKWVKGKYKI